MFTARCWFLCIAVSLALVACERDDPYLVQGYVEGEFVYVASPNGGQLQTLSVERGTEEAKLWPICSVPRPWVLYVRYTVSPTRRKTLTWNPPPGGAPISAPKELCAEEYQVILLPTRSR